MQCCFSDEGLFVLKCHGGKENHEGRLIIASYGGIVRYDLQPGEARLYTHLEQLHTHVQLCLDQVQPAYVH